MQRWRVGCGLTCMEIQGSPICRCAVVSLDRYYSSRVLGVVVLVMVRLIGWFYVARYVMLMLLLLRGWSGLDRWRLPARVAMV